MQYCPVQLPSLHALCSNTFSSPCCLKGAQICSPSCCHHDGLQAHTGRQLHGQTCKSGQTTRKLSLQSPRAALIMSAVQAMLCQSPTHVWSAMRVTSFLQYIEAKPDLVGPDQTATTFFEDQNIDPDTNVHRFSGTSAAAPNVAAVAALMLQQLPSLQVGSQCYQRGINAQTRCTPAAMVYLAVWQGQRAWSCSTPWGLKELCIRRPSLCKAPKPGLPTFMRHIPC